MICSYLSNHKQFLVVSNFNSSGKAILHCVPHDSILGPLLFLLSSFDPFLSFVFFVLLIHSCRGTYGSPQEVTPFLTILCLVFWVASRWLLSLSFHFLHFVARFPLAFPSSVFSGVPVMVRFLWCCNSPSVICDTYPFPSSSFVFLNKSQSQWHLQNHSSKYQWYFFLLLFSLPVSSSPSLARRILWSSYDSCRWKTPLCVWSLQMVTFWGSHP